MALAMRFEDSLRLVAEAEHDTASEPRKSTEALRCECQAIRSVAVALRDDSQQALSLAEPCMSVSPDAWTANVASNVVRFGHWKAGDLVSVYATPWVPFSSEDEKRNVFASVYRLCLLGLVKVQELRLELAERYYLEAM